jgi:hypothetical protein
MFGYKLFDLYCNYKLSGVLSSALNELTAKINNELALNEGVMKFNAFIFGLLK